MSRKRTPDERFWPKVKIGGPDDCWPWQGAKHEKGYGRFQLGTRQRQQVVPAHRFAIGAVSHKGPVRHTCDNPPCCNPRHLRRGTQTQNMQEAVRRRRVAVGEHHGQSRLTETEVRAIRSIYPQRSLKDLAGAFGVGEKTIHDVVTRKTWRHVA